MTRINVVPVEELTREHLVAEYRELPRVFAMAWKAHLRSANGGSKKAWTKGFPMGYTLGKGHMIFFYNKLGFLSLRHEALVQEMLKRGYKPNFTRNLKDNWCGPIPAWQFSDYTPTPEALALNRERIAKRLSGDKT